MSVAAFLSYVNTSELWATLRTEEAKSSPSWLCANSFHHR